METKFSHWLKRTRELYGSFFVLVITFVYLAQGLRQYSEIGLSYVMDDLGYAPELIQATKVFTKQPWNFKWVYGLLSDNLPILKRHCKPYLLFSSLLGIIGYVGLSTSSLSPAAVGLGAFLFLVQLSGAMADVLIDAMVVRFSRGTEDGSAGLQSMCWAAFAVGAFISNIAGGTMITFLDNKRLVFAILIFIPVVLLVLSVFVREPLSDFKPTPRALWSQIVTLFRAFFAPPFTILKIFTWYFISNAASFNMYDGYRQFRVSKCDHY
jgi:hypothetical protein